MGRAAAAIHSRMIEGFADVCGMGVQSFSAARAGLPDSSIAFRRLSANKTLALRDLAAKTLDGTVPTLARIRRMSDEAIIEHLTQVRGIGRWTVEMMLIFRLGRPDVLPVSDYGVRKGFALTFGKLKPTDKVTPADLPKPAEMEKRAQAMASLVLRCKLVHVARLRSGQAGCGCEASPSSSIADCTRVSH